MRARRGRLVLLLLFGGALFGRPGVGAAQPSLQARLTAARSGDTVVVTGGVHKGPLVIDRPLVLRGVGRPQIVGPGRGTVVTVAAPNVTLEGFDLSGSGFDLSTDDAAVLVLGDDATIRNNGITGSLHGIYVRGANRSRILDNRIVGAETRLEPTASGSPDPDHGGAILCEVGLSQGQRGNGIHLWKSAENLILRNRISGGRDGIYCSFVTGSQIADNEAGGVRFGLHYMYSDDNVVSGNWLHDNDAGATLMFSRRLLVRNNRLTGNDGLRGYGLLLQTVDESRFTDNHIARNTVGLFLDLSHNNEATGNQIDHNYIGLRVAASSSDNVLWENTIQQNLHQVELDGTQSVNRWSRNGRGNRWNRSDPVDLDGDGVGDLPHREIDLFGGVRRAFPWVSLLSASPGIEVLQVALRRAPVPGTAFLVDPAPLLDGPSPGTRPLLVVLGTAGLALLWQFGRRFGALHRSREVRR